MTASTQVAPGGFAEFLRRCVLLPVRLVPALWMFRRPAFLREWPEHPPLPAADPPAPPAGGSFLDVLGTFTGLLLAGSVDTRDVAAVLPKGVVLPDDAGSRTPITLAFGYQHDVHPRGLSWLPGSSYLELVAGVSGLRLVSAAGGGGPCAVLGRLCLNQLLPTILGRFMGLPKVLARATTTDRAFRIRALLSDEILASGELSPTGAVRRPEDAPGFAPVIASFAERAVSRSLFGTLLGADFEWHWNQGVLQEVAGRIELSSGFAGGCFDPGRVPPTATGAWRVRVPWTMRLPRRLRAPQGS